MLPANLSPIQSVILIALSLILPLSIFFGRGTVRRRRLGILEDLEYYLFGTPAEGRPNSFAPLALARAKYAIKDENAGLKGKARNILNYMLPTVIFVIISAVGLYLVLAATYDTLGTKTILMFGLPPGQNDVPAYQAGTALILAAAFIASYIWSVNYLILRVANLILRRWISCAPLHTSS